MTSEFLRALPHQIPFRAASAVVRRDETSIEGTYLVSADEPLPLDVMLIEAMAQFAGALALQPGRPGMLTGIDRCEVTRLPVVGDLVRITVTLDASFGGVHRFSGSGAIDGVEVVRGRFYLSDAQG
jgi:3-hydroxymyristoyl/3-hydroxydecanoyl-(acyl carrier protein) dehydratase